MIAAEPLLIVRLLMQVGEDWMACFDTDPVHHWLGIKLDGIGERDPQNCPFVRDPGGGPWY